MERRRALTTIGVVVAAVAVGLLGRLEAAGVAPAPCASPGLRGGVVVCDRDVGGGDDVGDGVWLFGGRIDVNTANARSLARVPGIGEATAARIVAWREAHGPFGRIDDLDAVDGVGPKTIERLRAVFEVR